MGKLVLTRKLGEKIVINKEIFITILDIRNTQIKLGIEAPPNVRIDREEVYLKRGENSGSQSISDKDITQIGRGSST